MQENSGEPSASAERFVPAPEGDASKPVCTPKPRENQLLRRLHKLGRHFRMMGEFAATRFPGWQVRETFQGVERFSMFLGYPFSGTSLLGSLIDAHPDAVISHEMNFLKYFRFGFSRDQIFQLVLRNSQGMAREGRTQSGYEFNVPNQWQGRFRRIRIIGDKRSSTLLRMVKRRPGLLDKFAERIGVPVNCFHMIRNPYDNITRICRESNDGRLDNAVEYYFWLVDILEGIRKRTAPENFMDLRLETLIADTTGSLRKACDFLKLEPQDDYVRDCAGIVFKSPRKTRFGLPWTQKLIDQVKSGIDRVEFLRGYTFED